MPRPSLRQRTTVASLLLLVSAGEASKDPNQHSSSFTFRSQHLSVDSKDSVSLSAETEALAFYSDTDEAYDSSTDTLPTVVSSSLLYDGGCYVSSEAMMISGGADASSLFLPGLENLYDSEFDESDDNDNDDDDGHSSMLSNASLSRSRRVSSLSGSNDSDTGAGDSHRSSSTTALSLRGGQVTSAIAKTAVGSDFAKKLLVAAIVTLAYEAVLGHLLEFIKIVMQTSPSGTTYGDVLKSITSEKGVIGIWDGFVPWGVVQAIFKGGVFGLAHAISSQLLLPLADEGKMPKQLALTLAGGIAGGFQGYVLSPTLLLKTRVMTNSVFRESMSLLRTTMLSFRIGFDVVADEGIGALMKGSNVFATKRVFDWATRYFFADVFEHMIASRKGGEALTAGEKIVASFLGGTASTLSTLPLDVLVAKTQDAKKAGVQVSALQLFRDELNELGWAGLRDAYTRGFVARLAHVCFTTVAMKTGSPYVYDLLFGEKEKTS